jgi:hypothetical protein
MGAILLPPIEWRGLFPPPKHLRLSLRGDNSDDWRSPQDDAKITAAAQE